MARAANGAASRRKGARWENEVRRWLAPIFPDAKRNLQSDHGRGGIQDVADVTAAEGKVQVECKSGYAVAVEAALRQLDDVPAREGGLSVLAVRTEAEGRRPRRLAIVPWDRFVGLLRAASLMGDLTVPPEFPPDEEATDGDTGE